MPYSSSSSSSLSLFSFSALLMVDADLSRHDVLKEPQDQVLHYNVRNPSIPGGVAREMRHKTSTALYRRTVPQLSWETETARWHL